MNPRRIGVIGYGHVGQFLVENIEKHDNLELAFVWNRTRDSLIGNVKDDLILDNLEDIVSRRPDLVVEVAHASITHRYAEQILQFSDYMVCSPTALCDKLLEERLRKSTTSHSLYIPCGALWGAEDISKMSDMGTLQRLRVTMNFHPDSLKLNSPLLEKNNSVTERTVLYEGPVRELCALAPNNVNTMAAASLAAHSIGGMDSVEACLVSDPSLTDYHVVEVEVWGKPNLETGHTFNVRTVRRNPALVGRVTGSATLSAFFSSVQRAHSRPPGVHFC